jgi:putative transposase
VFASRKTEQVHQAHYHTRAKARVALLDYLEVFYNQQRLHADLGYRTSTEPGRDEHGQHPMAV